MHDWRQPYRARSKEVVDLDQYKAFSSNDLEWIQGIRHFVVERLSEISERLLEAVAMYASRAKGWPRARCFAWPMQSITGQPD